MTLRHPDQQPHKTKPAGPSGTDHQTMNKKILLATAAILCSLALPAQQADNYRGRLRNRFVKVDDTNLPIVFVDVEGQMIQRDSYILAKMKVIDNGPGQTNHGDTIAWPNQTVDYEGWVALKYRGNSSFDNSDKKPYSFRTLDGPLLPADGGGKDKVKILGMGKDNKWAFIAPWCDEVMFRDILSFDLARPWMDYVPQGRLCEMFLDGTYYGVFALCERVSKGKHRLNLEDPGTRDGDLTGDYLVEIDRDDEANYVSKHSPWGDMEGNNELSWEPVHYQYKSPDDDDWADLPAGARRALQQEIDKMEDSFLADDWQEPDGGYRNYIDEMSFIDYLLATEVSMNVDGYRLSTNLYKYSNTRAEQDGVDPRWKMSLWDFNIAWGNANYYYGDRTDLWQYAMNLRNPYDGLQVPFYWHRMATDTLFVQNVKLRWQQYRQANYSDERLFATVDSLANLLTAGGAADRNERAWGMYNRSNIWPLPFYAHSYDEAYDYLTSWIRQRLAFMDQSLRLPRVIETMPITVADGWNADIVAEAYPASRSTSTALDGADRVFYAQSLRSNGGLPDDGRITSANESVQYIIGDYGSNQSLTMKSPGVSGTLTFYSPVETGELFILGTSGNGDASLVVTLNYADGGQVEVGRYAIRDWSVRNPQGDEAVSRLGNITRGSDALSGDNHYCLFDFSVPVEKDRPLASVTFMSTNYAYASVMALSALYEPVVVPTDIREMATGGTAGRTVEGMYTLDGQRIARGQQAKGVVVVRYTDGSSRKVVVR